MRNAADFAGALQIAKFARETGVDLINAHLAKDYPLTAIAARLARIPYVITRHVLFPMSRLHRLLLKDVAFVIAPSNAVAKSLRRQEIFPLEKMATIRYGLDVDNARDVVKSAGKYRVGAIGNLDPVKGFDTLIRCASIVKAGLPEVSFEVVGEDRSRHQRHEIELRKMISQLGLEKTVELSGWSDDIGLKLANFDLFVSASRRESFGFVIAEAMLAGVPVIATATEGAREIISDPALGVIVPIDSPVELADAILELLRDTVKIGLLGRNGPPHIVENFSLERMVNETEALYGRILKRR